MDYEIIKSINSELSGKYIKINKNPWESGVLNRTVIALVWDSPCDSIAETEREEIWTRALQNIELKLGTIKRLMFAARIPAGNREAIRALENVGFRLIECYLEFEHNLKWLPPQTGKSSIRPFQKNEIAELEKIAYESFEYSRFHSDSEISPTEANGSRSEWVRNSCRGRAEAVLVAALDNRIVGFVVCTKNKSERGIEGKLDLIAVHPDYRSRKIGYDLTVAFLRLCQDREYNLGKVGTQARNIASVRLYQKTGFLMGEAYYTYHKHIL